MKRLYVLALLSAVGVLSGCTTTSDGRGRNSTVNYNEAYENYVQLGAEYVRRGRYDLAEPKLKRAIAIDSNPPEAWNILAVLYEQTRDISSGEQVYRKLLGSHPDYLLGYMNYATFLCKFDRNVEMAELMAKMRSKGNNFSALSYISQGNCHQEKNRTAAAKTAYRQALGYDTHAAGALIPLANIELKQGNYQAASNYIKVVHTYVGYSPESVRVGILAARGIGNATLENELMRVMRGSYQGSQQASSLGI